MSMESSILPAAAPLEDHAPAAESFYGVTLDCIRRVQRDGDEFESWTYLERKVRGLVARALAGKRLPPDTEVEDLVQMVLTHIATSISVFRVERGASFAAWVQTVLHRKVTSLWRQSRRLKHGAGCVNVPLIGADSVALQVADEREPSPSVCARLHEVEARLREVLAGLKERHRHTIHLREEEGLPFALIAVRLGYERATTARSLYFRACEERRRLLCDVYDSRA